MPERLRRQGLNLFLFVLFAAAIAAAMNLSWVKIPTHLRGGGIAPYSIRADRDYEIVDEEATAKLRQAGGPGAEEAKDVVIKIQRGESIVRSGDRLEAWHIKVLEGIRKERSRKQPVSRWLGSFGFILLFLGLLFQTGRLVVRRQQPKRADLILQGSLLLTLLLLERMTLYFSDGIKELLPFTIPLTGSSLFMTVAAGVVVVRLLQSLEMALLFAIGASVFSGLLLENDLTFGLYFLTSGVATAWLSGSVRSRANILRIGVEAGVVQAVALFILQLATAGSAAGFSQQAEMPVLLAMAFLGGLFAAVVVLILLPLFESAFNYLSPIKLLEFGSLNHPLLREMIVRAPGTYHHSHMVGTLAEAACESIGADGLFARVACYFHDIGKLVKPPYFIENQRMGEDRHFNRAPSMSALIIASHGKEGIELGRRHKLPQRILDIIPQHQGTKLITYFYSKAKEAENRDLHVIDEKDYRYPGPKPQTREAGVILLADTVEASTRALKDRSPARLEEVVRNMINKNFIDGQFDECELTLKDLELIGKSFVRILMGIYHQRVEYPEIPSKETPSMVLPPHVDKYTPSSPLTPKSLREAPPTAPSDIPRIGPERRR